MAYSEVVKFSVVNQYGNQNQEEDDVWPCLRFGVELRSPATSPTTADARERAEAIVQAYESANFGGDKIYQRDYLVSHIASALPSSTPTPTAITAAAGEICKLIDEKAHFLVDEIPADAVEGIISKYLQPTAGGASIAQGPCSACGDGDTAMKYHTHERSK